MKKFVALITLITILFASASFAAIFPDIEEHWAKEYIDSLAMDGVISGMSDGSFAPDSAVTREQFLKMLMIATSKSVTERNTYENPPKADSESENPPFEDVSAERWSYYYIKEAYGNIIFTEEYGENFEPVRDITREEAAVWMARSLQLSEAEPEFTDNELIGNKNLVGASAAAGLISGFPDKSFGPGQTLTRAQAAVILSKAERYNAQAMLSNYTESIKEFTRDLNGDNEDDKAEVVANNDGYMLKVNDLAVLGGECDVTENRYYIIDIDKDDEYKEIAIAETDYGNSALAVYRYTGSALYLMGRIETVGDIAVRTDSTPIGDDWGAVSVNRDGTITANIGVQFVHTMLIRKQYTLNEKMRLSESGGDYFTIGKYSDFTVTDYLESARSDSEHPKITLTPGYAGTIVKTDLKNWIYIETGSGDSGWIYVSDDGLVNGERLSHYLEGLNYAG